MTPRALVVSLLTIVTLAYLGTGSGQMPSVDLPDPLGGLDSLPLEDGSITVPEETRLEDDWDPENGGWPGYVHPPMPTGLLYCIEVTTGGGPWESCPERSYSTGCPRGSYNRNGYCQSYERYCDEIHKHYEYHNHGEYREWHVYNHCHYAEGQNRW